MEVGLDRANSLLLRFRGSRWCLDAAAIVKKKIASEKEPARRINQAECSPPPPFFFLATYRYQSPPLSHPIAAVGDRGCDDRGCDDRFVRGPSDDWSTGRARRLDSFSWHAQKGQVDNN